MHSTISAGITLKMKKEYINHNKISIGDMFLASYSINSLQKIDASYIVIGKSPIDVTLLRQDHTNVNFHLTIITVDCVMLRYIVGCIIRFGIVSSDELRHL